MPDPMPEPIVLQTFERCSVLRFDRPGIRNPLSTEVLDRIERIFENLENGSSPVIFTGTDGVCASGADLREIAAVDAASAKDFARRGQSVMNRIASAGVLTIAAINGYCFGGALDLALACRKRLASPDAVFSHPGTGLGIITGWGGTQRLPRLIGEGRALEMFFTAGRFSAAEALRFGLVDEVAEDALARAIEIANRV